MKKRVLITTPIPTPEELADQLGVSQARLKRIQAILRDEGLMAPRKPAKKSAPGAGNAKSMLSAPE